MASYELISTNGEFPDITLAKDSLYLVYQLGSRLVVEWRNPDLKLLKTWAFPLTGASGAFGRIKYHDDRVYIGYRLGNVPYTGHVHPIDIERPANDLGQIHGALPLVFGENGFAYIAGDANAGYPVHVQSWTGEFYKNVRRGQGTGLSRLDDVKSVTLADEDKNIIPGLSDPSWAGPCVVGATDRDAQKCIVAQLPDGRECELWKGQDSPNPRMCTDGTNFYVIVWSGSGDGIRLAKISTADFKKPVARAFGVRVEKAKALGYFFERSILGEFSPKRNSTFTGSNLWLSDLDGDNDQELPADIDVQLAKAIDDAGTAFLAVDGNDFSRKVVKYRWPQILGVWTHEPDSPELARDWAVATRLKLKAEGLAARPVVTVIDEFKCLDKRYAGVSDAIMPEIYFVAPEATYAEQLKVARERIEQVCKALSPTPLYLAIQAFDRIAGGTKWKNAPWAMEAIQQAGNEAIVRDQVLGIFWFAYGRKGGVKDYPELERWHSLQYLVTPIPPPIVDSKPPAKPPQEKKTVVPSQAEMRDFLAVLHSYYVDELRRPGGIFEAPDPEKSLIKDARRPDVFLDDYFVVWTSNYLQWYQEELKTPGGPHEAAKRRIRQVLHDSDEARRKRGEIGNPQ